MAKTGSVRIIAGKWRSRRINFIDQIDLRPTHDRLRETLFNWLAPSIEDATCLDLFAGSGALGFEALSRGAKAVTFIDSSREVCHLLKETIDKLGPEVTEIIHARIPENKVKLQQKFDIVFIDPPFRKGLLAPTLEWLLSLDLLNEHSLLYIEFERRLDFEIPEGWQWRRLKDTKSLKYGLLERQ